VRLLNGLSAICGHEKDSQATASYTDWTNNIVQYRLSPHCTICLMPKYKFKHMKLICLLICCVLIGTSCSKDTPDPDPVYADTLSAGWTKTVIDTEENFSDIYFADNAIGYASGNSIYRSVNGGITWTNLNANLNVVNIAVSPNGNLLAVNQSDTVYRINYGTNQLTKTRISGSNGFLDVFFVNNQEGMVAGYSKLYQTIDTGLNWQQVAISNPTALGIGQKPCIHFIDNNTGWIASESGIIKTNGNINNWQMCNVPPNTFNGSSFTTVFGCSSSIVYMVNRGRIYKSINGGTDFLQVAQLPFGVEGYFLQDLHFINENTGYVHVYNRIYKTTDGGLTWQVVVALVYDRIIEIHFTDANHGWACGTRGTILRFNN
jgi:photosystem II stability/assembly factor-like uncharacterized protein